MGPIGSSWVGVSVVVVALAAEDFIGLEGINRQSFVPTISLHALFFQVVLVRALRDRDLSTDQPCCLCLGFAQRLMCRPPYVCASAATNIHYVIAVSLTSC